MLKSLFVAAGLVAVAVCTQYDVMAQEPSTLVLKSGERISGDLVDMNASGFALRVGGSDRTVSVNDVAAIEFAGGSPSADVVSRLNAGHALAVLRNGQVVEGRLSDVGGTRPLRLTFDTTSGARDLNSSDVAQVYLAPVPGATAAAAAAQAVTVPAGAQTVTVQANQAWTDTGITVQRGEAVQFIASGDIMVSAQASSGVGGSPVQPGGKLPVAATGVGALIGRIGNGAPFLIGSNTAPIPMSASGRLQLGVNDDHYADNTGSFTVAISRLGRTR
jgi:hypothetical protein